MTTHLRTLTTGVLLIWGVVAGCGGDDDGSGPSPTTLSVGGGLPAGATTTGPGPGGGGGADVAAGGGASACVDASTPSVEVYPAGSDRALTRLVRIGSRWLAAGFDGYVRFDDDGANADPEPTSFGQGGFHVLAAEPALGAVGYGAAGDTAVAYQRLGEVEAITGPRGLASEVAQAVAVAAADDVSVVVWARNGALWGRTVDGAGAPGDGVFLVQAGAYATSVRLFGVSGGSATAVFGWTGASTPGVFQSQLLRLDPADPAGGEPPNPFFVSADQHELLGIAATDDGYAALVQGGPGGAQLLSLDGFGNAIVSSGALPGALPAYGLASLGDRIAVVARGDDGSPRVRVFDLDLVPVGPWVCLDVDHDPTVAPTVAPDPAEGFAVLYQRPDGSTHLIRVDDGGYSAGQIGRFDWPKK
ncbi:MAG: hypothetical protein AAF715_23885 [Myxococcota bacterium]